MHEARLSLVRVAAVAAVVSLRAPIRPDERVRYDLVLERKGFPEGPVIPPPFPECAAAVGPSELECPAGSVGYCEN